MNKNRKTVKTISLIGLLAAFCTVARVLLSPLPNIQPVFDTIIIITLFLGFREGFILTILTIVVSNLYLGFGVWTFAQIFAYLVCIGTIALINKFVPLQNWWWLQLFICGFAGIEYGFFVSLGVALLGSAPSFIPYWISGLSYDLGRSVGNLIFYPILYFPLSKLIKKYKNKY